MTGILVFVATLGTTPGVVAGELVFRVAEAAAQRQELRTRSGLRTSYRRLIRQTASQLRPRPDPRVVVPQLVRLEQAVRVARTIAPSEKRRMRSAIKVRLEAQLKRLRRDLRSFATARRRTARQAPRLAGPVDEATARGLIALIQNTIAPASWDTNGGKGTIRYFSPLKVLVIRNTDEVHRQIGGTLRPGNR